MRLLFITQDFPPDVGGIQTYAVELARRLAPRCDDFAVLAPTMPGAAAVDAALPFEVIRLNATADSLALKAFGPVRRLARARGFDTAFHVQWPTALSTMLARFAGGPRRIFVAAHGRELLFEPLSGVAQVIYDAVRALILRHADGLFPVSSYTADLLETLGAPAERITILHNGTDPATFRPADAAPLRAQLGLNGQRVLLTVGRLVGRKGIDTVLHALPDLARAVPGVTYLVAGDGPDRPRLEALARRLGVDESVRFVGSVNGAEDLRDHYNACDVFVMPAREAPPDVEGFGIVFLEAGACGKPVVGARAGGVPDAIRHGETGLLVAPDDAPALAASLSHLLHDEAEADRLGRRGRQRVVEEATWDHVAERLYAALHP